MNPGSGRAGLVLLAVLSVFLVLPFSVKAEGPAGGPEVETDPGGFREIHDVFTNLTTETLTIENTGATSLTWSLRENDFGGSNVQGETLYDQRNNAGVEGFPSQDFITSNNNLDSQGADDFVVPAGETWVIDILRVDGLYGDGEGVVPQVNVRFYEDDNGQPGAQVPIYNEKRPVIRTDADFTVSLSNAVFLGAGTYWVSIQAVMDNTNTREWQWATRTVQSGNAYVWQNPEDGFGTGCVAWESGAEVCGITSPGEVDALFALEGRRYLASACTTENDAPWLSTDVVSGTLDAGESTTVTVMFNSQSLQAGFYQSVLCVLSNDADESMIPVAAEMDVIIVDAVEVGGMAVEPVPTPLQVPIVAGILVLGIVVAIGYRTRR